MPAWNEEVGLLPTVKSILKSTYSDIEIIVVNDGSTDHSDQQMIDFISDYKKNPKEGINIIYHYQENQGKGTALNKGIALSTGEIIVTIDADCEVHENALTNFVACFADKSVMAAVGNVKVGNTSSIIGMTQYLEFIFSFYFKKADSFFGSIYIIGGAAGAFRKSIFEKIGTYSDQNITEDIELTVRIQKAGMKIVYASDAIVYTEGASDIIGLKKQRIRWKRGRIDTFIQHRDLFFSKKKQHNKFLTWFILPFTIFGDTQILLEIPFIIFLIVLSFITRDFTPFIATLSIITFVFYIQSISEIKNNSVNPYLLAPIAWLMFYLVTIIEINALFTTLPDVLAKRELKWQKWERKGVK
ncbi:MAG: glycosyltransferase [Bacteroidota bacterium]|nr:glycosyltransferase [Bacteroidota bacterium]